MGDIDLKETDSSDKIDQEDENSKEIIDEKIEEIKKGLLKIIFLNEIESLT